MLSSMLIIVYISLFIALVQSHELPLHRRDHATISKKRFLKNRSPLELLEPPVANAASLPASSDSQTAASTVSQSTVSDTTSKTISSLTSSTSTSTSTGTTSTTASSNGTSTTSSPKSSSTSTNTSSPSTSSSKSSASLNLTPLPATPTLNVVSSTITSTQSVSASPSDTTVPQLQSASAKTKNTTVTVLIAIAASVGGVAILWTIFRKWKLSSSKEFDRRLNPITDWQPTGGAEDDIIPALRRAPSSASSFHSGGGNGHSSSRSAGHGNERGLAPPDHDFTAGPTSSAPIGGYADLARTSSPNPPMQQALGRGPSLNHGYDYGVPLHHQTGYNTYDAYDYNTAGVRY